MSVTVLVVGGTGMLGEPVARQLAAAGYRVRVLTRNAEAARTKLGDCIEVAQGDVEDAAAVGRALTGCAGVHISLDGRGDWDLERRGAECVAAAAARLRPDRITLISGASACEQNAWFPMTRAKLAAERAVRASQVPFTIFRCTMFMETLPTLVREGRAMVMGRQSAAWHWVAARDYAAMVARAYATPAAAGRTLYVYGPEALTFEAALERYRAACASEATLTRIPFWALALLAAMPRRTELRQVGLPIMRYFSRVREMGDSAEADALLGKPVTTLDEWCAERSHAAPRTPAAAPSP